MDGGRRKVAPRRVTRVVDECAGAASRCRDRGIDRRIAGGRENQQRSFGVGVRKRPLMPAQAAACGERGDLGGDGRTDERDVGAGLEQASQLARGDRPAAGNERAAAPDAQYDRVHEFNV